MRAILLLAAALLSSPARAAQLAVFDTLGRKGGPLEMFYSPEGRAALVEAAAKRLKSPGDSVYFIFEQEDFSQAVLVNAHVQTDGRLLGTAGLYARSKQSTRACDPKTMGEQDVAYRATTCYYNRNEYSSPIGYPGMSYKSAAEFIDEVIAAAEEFAPTPSIYKVLEAMSLDREFQSLADVYRTSKMAGFLAMSVLNESGWFKDLSDASGWSKTHAPLHVQQIKLLAGIRQLRTDGAVYMSHNVRCGVGGNPILPRSAAVDCRTGTFMAEHPEQFYEAMAQAGYSYDGAAWKKPGRP